MRRLIIAAAGLAVAMIPATASAQQYQGRGGWGYNDRDVRQEVRECRRELRRADSRREYRRELRECRREIARAQRGNRYDGYDDNRGRHRRRGW
ncbi:MAG TPA: hypothetical protein VGB54_03180 [Allosphingosinicella sp.]|jgi:hypothetical protein